MDGRPFPDDVRSGISLAPVAGHGIYFGDMKKENVIILAILCLIVGFVAGVGAGIRFASKDVPSPAAATAPSQGELVVPSPPNAPSREEIVALEELIRKDPNNLQALIDLGNRYFDAQAFEKAIDAYSKALKLDPRNGNVRTDMAIMYRGLKDYDRAVKELKEAAASDPLHVNSRYNLGIILLHDKKDAQGAIAAWEDCLRAGASGEEAEKIRHQLRALKDMTK
jgi:cytochrome c-type biogenesis protein CcmH/NrfG